MCKVQQLASEKYSQYIGISLDSTEPGKKYKHSKRAAKRKDDVQEGATLNWNTQERTDKAEETV